MTDGDSAVNHENKRAQVISEELAKPTGDAANILANHIVDQHPESAVILYGSGNSVLSNASPTDVLFDFYVITPSYKKFYKTKFLAFLNFTAPPNVFYIEMETPEGRLRAKYAVLSISHFEKLISKKTFHSYFWARFAQPARIVSSPADLRPRLENCIMTAIDTFVARAAPLVPTNASTHTIWRTGLARSYKAELRAEPPERIDKLLASYGSWAEEVTAKNHKTGPSIMSAFAWQLRSAQGAFLSVLRLLKATTTFHGGVDYIVWKIERHSGISVSVKPWERQHPFFGSFSLAWRYYRLKARATKTMPKSSNL